MALPPRIALATRNAHKIRELSRICADWPVEWATVANRDPASFPDVEETGETYLDNAVLKARAVADALGMPALADDSGIEVDALGGKPGPRSARFAGAGASDLTSSSSGSSASGGGGAIGCSGGFGLGPVSVGPYGL